MARWLNGDRATIQPFSCALSPDHQDVAVILQYLTSGITLGAVYALVALGFVTTYNASGVINFAQGEFVMLGGMLTIFFLKDLKLPYGSAALLAVTLTALVGVAMYQLVIVPLRRASVLIMIMATLGVSIFLQNMAMLLWGPVALSLPPISGGPPLRFAGASVALQSLWVIGMAICVLGALYLLSNHTLSGKAMTASATDPLAANLVGISIGNMVRLAFGISAAVGAIAGVFITPIFFTSYRVGAIVGLKGFVAAVLGGWGKSTGAVLGGLMLGVLEAISVILVPAGYKDAVALLALLLILYFRPTGVLAVDGD